jgi:uncharacterized membrane protein HdeD (DUF308 family)
MSLSALLLAVWLILVGLVWLTWVTISVEFLGGFALVVGVVMILEGLSVFSYSLPSRKRD